MDFYVIGVTVCVWAGQAWREWRGKRGKNRGRDVGQNVNPGSHKPMWSLPAYDQVGYTVCPGIPILYDPSLLIGHKTSNKTISKSRQIIRSLAVFKLPDSANYFLSHWERILDKDFLPLGEDIVRWVSKIIFPSFLNLYLSLIKISSHWAKTLSGVCNMWPQFWFSEGPILCFSAIISWRYAKHECSG